MAETPQQRLTRLVSRAAAIKGEVKALRANPGRNVEHKIARLNDQGIRVQAKITELRG